FGSPGKDGLFSVQKLLPHDAVRLLEQYAGSNSEAAYMLAVICDEGLGVERDLEVSRQWLRLALRLDHEATMAKLQNALLTAAIDMQTEREAEVAEELAVSVRRASRR